MPRQRRRSASSPPEVVVDIDGVTAASKLSELTVEQFVQLLMQVRTESGSPPDSLRRRRRAEAIAELIEVLKSHSEPVEAVKKSFAEIGRTIPQVLLEVARRIREAQERESQDKPAAATEPNGSQSERRRQDNA